MAIYIPLLLCVYILFSLTNVAMSQVSAKGTELTFELPDNEKMCFYEMIDTNVRCTLEFQVIMHKTITFINSIFFIIKTNRLIIW